jgi:hypothetical protein
MAASLVLLATCGYLGYDAFNQASTWTKNASDASNAQQQLVVIRADHAAELEKKKAIGIDFMLIENSTKVYDKLEKRAMKPLGVFDMIGKSLGPDIRITSLDVRAVETATSLDPAAVPDPNATPVDPNAPVPPKEYEVVLRIVFPAELAPEKGVQKIDELEKRLQSNLPAHKVSIIKQVADLSYTGNFVGEATSQLNKDKQKEDYEAQIMIRGTML